MEPMRNNETTAASGRCGPNLMLIIIGVVVALFVVFFLQNGERTSIDFLVFEKITTIRWSLLMAMVLGVVIDRLFSIWWRRRGKRKNDTD